MAEHVIDGYPVVITVPIAWGDLDAFAHVNNTVYFRWFESARIAYFDRIGFREPASHAGVGSILASTQCRFRLPLAYPGTVRVNARVAEIGTDRFTMEYRVLDAGTGALAAEGSGVIVAYDYAQRAKCALPAAVVGQIRELEGLTGSRTDQSERR